MVEILIHPGFVKTGTTFFQENIIPKIKNSIILGKPYKIKNNFQNNFKSLFYSKSKVSNNKIETLSTEIVSLVKKKKIKRIIFSDESFFDSEFYNPNKNIRFIKKFIFYLEKKINIKIKILLTIRNQSSVIISRYAYLFPKFKNKYPNLNSYINYNIKNNSYFFKSLKYYNFSAQLKKNFKSDIILLPIEILENDKKKYGNTLKKIFRHDVILKKINFSKKNVNSKNNNFFLKEENFWTKYYNILYKFKNKLPKKTINYIPLNNKIRSYLFKKIKYNQSSISIKYNSKTYKKIFKFYLEDNKKLYNMSKINYKTQKIE